MSKWKELLAKTKKEIESVDTARAKRILDESEDEKVEKQKFREMLISGMVKHDLKSYKDLFTIYPELYQVGLKEKINRLCLQCNKPKILYSREKWVDLCIDCYRQSKLK